MTPPPADPGPERRGERFLEEQAEAVRRAFEAGAERVLAEAQSARRLSNTGVPPPNENLVGLTLSGGGVRSATFALGALQGLAHLDLLRIFDYLSTVSGGGFVGGWWSAWLARPERQPGQRFPELEDLESSRQPARIVGSPDQAVRAVPGMPEGSLSAGHDPIHHLRLFANYLTPRRGILSADTWRAITFYLRGLIFTWMSLLPVLLAVLMAAQLYFVVAGPDHVGWGFCLLPARHRVPPGTEPRPRPVVG